MDAWASLHIYWIAQDGDQVRSLRWDHTKGQMPNQIQQEW